MDSFLLDIIKILIPAIISILAIFLGRYIEKRAALEKELRQKKLDTYNNFLEFLKEFIIERSYTQKLDYQSQTEAFQNVSIKILSYGDEELITLYENFIQEIEKLKDKDVNRASAIDSIDNILIKMRADIGFKDRVVKKGSLIGLISPTYKDIMLENNSTIKTNNRN